MIQDFRVGRESSRSGVRRQFAKIAVAALGVAGLTVAGLAGASAHGGDGWDDDAVIAPSGGFVAPGGLDDNGWDDDMVITSISGSGGSDDSVWHDQWDDD